MTQNHNKKVKAWASLLLGVMVILYITSRSFEHQHELWSWVRAFSEAGMIGALADWFAVVALFRHPLRLPIPHTAIIQKQKDKIGRSLGRFVKQHFLTEDLITYQLHKYAPLQRGLAWLGKEQNTSKVAQFLGQQLSKLVEGDSYRDTCKTLAKPLCQKLSTIPLEQEIGKWIVASIHGDNFREMVAPIFAKLAIGIERNKEWVGQEAGQRAPVVGSKILSQLTRGVTEAVSSHMVIQVADQLKEASGDTSHTFYDKLEEALNEFGEELMDDTETKGEWALWRSQIFTSKTAEHSCERLLLALGDLFKEESSQLQSGLTSVLLRMTDRIQSDEAFMEAYEERFIHHISQLSTEYAEAFEQLISERFQAWDPVALTEQIERNIGADLQFIRINGSLIGGLIGLALYGVGLMVWGG